MSNEKGTPDLREEAIRGLRALADFLADHPDLPAPASASVTLAWPHDDNAAGTFRRLVALGATAKASEFNENKVEAELTFGPIVLRTSAQRDKVQQRVVVGFELVDGEKIPVHTWREASS